MIFLWILFGYIVFSEFLIWILSRPYKLSDVQYILVLGNKGGIQSLVTQDRAKKAILAKKEYPQAKIILTGNEDFKEVANYKQLLQQEGLQDFIEEKLSQSTWDNMKNSLALMTDVKIKKTNVLVITSRYHQPRSVAMARSLGMNAERFCEDFFVYKKSKIYFLKERISNLIYSPRILWNYLRFH